MSELGLTYKITQLLICSCYILDNYIQKSRKNFMDSRSRRNINRLNDELQDVQRIMVQNIDDVLQRGETLSGKYFIWLYTWHIFILI